MANKLSAAQQAMLEKIGQYRWRRLLPLDITINNPTLRALQKMGLIQIRRIEMPSPVGSIQNLQLHEVRRVAMQDAHGQLRDAAMRLINALPSATRSILKVEVAAVLACIIQEETKND